MDSEKDHLKIRSTAIGENDSSSSHLAYDAVNLMITSLLQTGATCYRLILQIRVQWLIGVGDGRMLTFSRKYRMHF